jgi:exopolyphosphatase/guanosine-5'-triphosphate,3'-diphosphate pyrophosphatase
MRKGVIDLGTNTFNLLIADVFACNFELVHSEKDGVALGMGGINHNRIANEAMVRGFNAIRHFKAVCDDYQVQEIQAFGTSALRDASNSLAFLNKVQSELGIKIQIISGELEAELIYKGVKWSYDFEVPSVIMDIGGGSTEFVFADQGGITDLVSLNIGVSRIYQHFHFSDPLSKHDVSNIEGWLDEHAEGFFYGKQEQILVGASGSFETFYELIHNEPFPSKINSVEISLIELKNSLSAIIASSQAERDQNSWIIPIRKRMAPIAAVKTRWVLNKLDIQRVFISPCSLKEGALALS